MPYTGHCNCESIRITLPQQPPSSVVCHCDNCKRAGGPFSVNYLVPLDEISLEDPSASLKSYDYKNPLSGNFVKRHFCSACGSAVWTATPMTPGKVFLKATLFDSISPSGSEVFGEKRLPWVNIEQQSQ